MRLENSEAASPEPPALDSHLPFLLRGTSDKDLTFRPESSATPKGGGLRRSPEVRQLPGQSVLKKRDISHCLLTHAAPFAAVFGAATVKERRGTSLVRSVFRICRSLLIPQKENLRTPGRRSPFVSHRQRRFTLMESVQCDTSLSR